MGATALPARLERCPRAPSAVGVLDVRCAQTFRARLMGLAFLSRLPPGCGLLLPKARSVHTFGMRFALDLVWIDGEGGIVRVDESVAPARLRFCGSSAGVLELTASSARREGLRPGQRVIAAPGDA